MKSDITAIILTKNEEVNIRRCIRSLDDFVKRIIVVDSGSTDATIQIAQEEGAEIYRHPFKHYADQFNWALDHINIYTVWIYRIDADEAITPELKEELKIECQAHAQDEVNGFLMKHKLFFMGRYLTHGGVYPFIKMTVFKTDSARFENRAMGEHVVLKTGTAIQLKNDCLHYDCKSLTAYIEKHNSYSDREVYDYHMRQEFQQSSLYKKAEITRKLRDGFYYKLPKFFRARLYFWYRYYIKLGFLDGTPGKIYALIQAYFYRVIVDAKIYEAEVNNRREKN